jgi:hypothetical protein
VLISRKIQHAAELVRRFCLNSWCTAPVPGGFPRRLESCFSAVKRRGDILCDFACQAQLPVARSSRPVAATTTAGHISVGFAFGKGKNSLGAESGFLT